MEKVFFWNHPVFPFGMTLNVVLAVLPFLFLVFLIRLQGKKGLKAGLVQVILLLLWVLFLPNSAYLGVEFKHLILADGRVPDFLGNFLRGDLDWMALGFFGLVSVLGLITYFGNVMLAGTHLRFMQKQRYLWYAVLGMASGVGVGLGHSRLSTYGGITNPLVMIEHFVQLINNPWLLVAVACLGVFLAVGSILLDKKFVVGL